MANNQEEYNSEDFSQDVNAGEEEHQNGDTENGDSAAANANGNGSNVSAEAPGRDDDR